MNERQAYLAIRNAIRLENLSDDIAQKVAPALRAIFNELGNQFRRMPPGNLEREIWYRQQRLRIADLLAPLSREMGAELRQRLGEEVAQQMHYAQNYLRVAGEDPANLVAAAAPQDGVSLSLDGGAPALGRPQFTRTQLHAITQDVRVMGERLEDLFEPVIGRGEVGPWIRQNLKMIDTKVKAGFLTGQTSDQIAAQLPGFGAEAIRRNKAIARTAVMDLSAKANEAFWLANSDVIAGWEVDSTMDNRVCERCAPWDGEFNKDRNRLPTFPLHINCRCRALPLSNTEMLLREEDGPQRRSVVELIEAPSKEDAIALAKAKPGVVAARAYAGQVKVDGKKYWRVAKDIVQKDHPLTMGEFLRQASPQTQEQVLGSKKRVSKFLGWIGGKDGNTPMSPDLALKRVVEWKPTVSRKPRLSAEMRLEISKLKSQKELMRKNSEGDAHIVYGYLRAKDSGTAKAGTPYYIGIGNEVRRPYMPHRRGTALSKFHDVPVPKDEALIRQFGVFPNRAAAAKREQDLIARYGRKGMDKGGILLNRTKGGEGTVGVPFSKTLRRARNEYSSSKYGIAEDVWEKLSSSTKRKVYNRYNDGLRGADLLDDAVAKEFYAEKRAAASKARLANELRVRGITEQQYRDEIKAKAQMRQQAQRSTEAYRASRRKSDAELLTAEQRSARMREAMKGVQFSKQRNEAISATKIRLSAVEKGLDPDWYASLSARDRKLIVLRWNKGKRGQDLASNLGERIDRRAVETANRLGVPYDRYISLTAKQRSTIRARHKAGKRGAALLVGLTQAN